MPAALLTALFLQAATVLPQGETTPVDGLEDAADDPAVWINRTDPSQSLILGTDKRAGLRIYGLDGTQRQFLPVGALNNVDLRQGVTLADWSGDLAAATNRSDDSVVLFSITASGAEELGRFSTNPDPYGFCMGRDGNDLILFVAHRQGYVQPFILSSVEDRDAPVTARPLYLDSQVEGCVYDDTQRRLFVGEENKGIWRVGFRDGTFGDGAPVLIDAVGGEAGLTADVEGLSLYETGPESGYLLASSQGDNSFHVYSRLHPHGFLGKFRIMPDPDLKIDGAQDTDGIESVFTPLGPAYPRGLLVVQDGYNVGADLSKDGVTPDEKRLHPQNFKIVDWRRVEKALTLE